MLKQDDQLAMTRMVKEGEAESQVGAILNILFGTTNWGQMVSGQEPAWGPYGLTICSTPGLPNLPLLPSSRSLDPDFSWTGSEDR